MLKKIWIMGLLIAGIGLSGCSPVISPSEMAETESLKAAEQKVLEEKQQLSAFVNLAYQTDLISELPELVSEMERKIDKVTESTAVKMALHLEMAQRIALQNDPSFGEVSAKLSEVLNRLGKSGLVHPDQVSADSNEVLEELNTYKRAWLVLMSSGDKWYLNVDYSAYQTVSTNLSREYKLYQLIMSEETAQPSVRDQKLAIEPGTLVARLKNVDSFYQDYPVPSDGILQTNLGDEFQLLGRLLVIGTASESRWDKEGVLLPKWQSSWIGLSFNPESQLYLPWEQLKNLLAASQYRRTPEVTMQIQQILKTINDLVNMTGG